MSRSWRIVLGLAWASLVANCLLVVTGGAVRLTGSGLGCPTWPQCGDGSYVTHSAYGLHGAIEFGNRMLTFVLALVAVATLVSALTARPYRRGPVLLALGLFLGIPAQAVIGGITVLTKLNPWVVMLHLMCSLLMVAAAALLVVRVREGDAPARSELAQPLRHLTSALLGLVLVICYLGAVVTGSGPHAGDLEAKRTGLDPDRMSQLHADGVFLLVGLTVALLVALHATGAPAVVRRAAAVLLVVELAQSVIGFVQFFTGLPAALVAAHMLGATVLVAAAVHLVLSTRTRATRVPAARPAASAARPAVAART
ncbi:cytochrome c oxidase assembly protein subunit 15 [Motilibacter peucedani]|uniref:Cytochrome c oxidase assembly protein subunit 15 n=1 Tax=Motilibacter peucedani TaxID=598650 RepID=A0A420XV82_9ACTN|nr:COX15/CtaA family protein [Motilibacter peucedani]RKS84198.1 cytochrome c oxidase assembly protein subunit 15 [Motilibacter peucedani]